MTARQDRNWTGRQDMKWTDPDRAGPMRYLIINRIGDDQYE